jgi:molybdopterin-guanine dinucleotide biosynthesis adapter protein
MSFSPPPVLQIVGYSNSGKTTLLTSLVSHLTDLGFRVGTIKHHHREMEMDKPGKDSWKHRQSGAHRTALLSANQAAVFFSQTLALEECLFYFADLDIVLVEGYKWLSYPKLVMMRGAEDLPLLQQLTNIRGIVVKKRFPDLPWDQYGEDELDRIAKEVLLPFIHDGGRKRGEG